MEIEIKKLTVILLGVNFIINLSLIMDGFDNFGIGGVRCCRMSGLRIAAVWL